MNYYVQIGVGRWGFKAKRNKLLCRMVIHQAAATRCGIAETLGGNVFSPCESPLHGRILLLCWRAVGKPVFTSRLYWAPVKTRFSLANQLLL